MISVGTRGRAVRVDAVRRHDAIGAQVPPGEGGRQRFDDVPVHLPGSGTGAEPELLVLGLAVGQLSAVGLQHQGSVVDASRSAQESQAGTAQSLLSGLRSGDATMTTLSFPSSRFLLEDNLQYH